ncbi:hypothetical protein BH23CHL5_BH23CHL5_17480 [soil metagenome]
MMESEITNMIRMSSVFETFVSVLRSFGSIEGPMPPGESAA